MMNLIIVVASVLVVTSAWSMFKDDDTVTFLRRLSFVMGMSIFFRLILESLKVV